MENLSNSQLLESIDSYLSSLLLFLEYSPDSFSPSDVNDLRFHLSILIRRVRKLSGSSSDWNHRIESSILVKLVQLGDIQLFTKEAHTDVKYNNVLSTRSVPDPKV